MLKKLLLALLFITTVLNATAPTEESVTKLYIATFDRAPDAKGLDYWLNDSGLSLEEIAESFFNQDETKEKYPAEYSDEDFIIEVYNNLFDRDPDQAGFDYWLEKLQSGDATRDYFILMVVNGAQGDDKKLLDHKTEVGLAFAHGGRNDIKEAYAIMEDVTADHISVDKTLCEFDLSECPNPEKPNPAPPAPPGNIKPVADAGTDQSDVIQGTVVELDGSASFDPKGNPLTYMWTMKTKPAGSTATLSSATAQKPTFTVDKAEIYTVELIVNNGKVDSVSSVVNITVNANVNTSVLVGEGSTSNSNTTRNIAADGQGNIYVAYHSNSGIYVSNSTDNGHTFKNPIEISDTSSEVELSISGSQIFIAWVENGHAMISRSIDSGEHYSSPINVGSMNSAQVHMASDGSNVYLIAQNGMNFLYSNDNGLTFTAKDIAPGEAFADVQIDPVSKEVFVQTDNPNIYYYESSDFGTTFSSAIAPGGSIFYSATAISSGDNGRYLFISGKDMEENEGKAYRIDLDTQSSTELLFGENTTILGRTLAADGLGNFVDGYQNGSAIYFAVSHDLGDNFASAIQVSDNAEHLNVFIDSLKKVSAAYTENGQVFVNTYHGLLK